jgi:hypothetical protein
LETSQRKNSILARSLSWLLLLLGLAAASAAFALQLQGCQLPADVPSGEQLPIALVLAGLAFAGIGCLLTARRPENRIGWLIAWLGVALPLAYLPNNYVVCAVGGALALPRPDLVAWFDPYLGILAIVPLFVLLPAWFPDGKFMTRRWAWLFWALLAAILLFNLGGSLVPGRLNSHLSGEMPFQNPFGVPWAFLEQIQPVLIAGLPLGIIVAVLVAIIEFVRRFRQATGDTRQQFKWFALFLSTVVVVHILGFEVVGLLFYPALLKHWSYQVILALSAGGFPVVIGLAIFKYRLYDIDLIIRRTLSYGVLTGLLAVTYFGGVAILQATLGALTGEARTPLVTVITTLVIAALFNPLRRRVQDFIDRRFYRRKYSAEQTLARFAATVRDEVDVDQLKEALVGVVEETMQPAHLSLWLKAGSRLRAEEVAEER